MTFNNIQVKFLVTIANQSSYIFNLISINSDAAERNKNMEALVNAIKTMQYVGTRTTAITKAYTQDLDNK